MPTGAILAGGAARRLGGVPKGLLRVGGARVVDRVAAALRAVSDEIVLVANAPQADGWLPGVVRIPDERLGRGAMGGVHAALEYARRRHGGLLLVVAWDMPFVSPALLHSLVARWHDVGAGRADAVVPEHRTPSGEARAEPLCALYAPSALGEIERRLGGDDVRMHALVGALRTVWLSAADVPSLGPADRIFLSVNDAADLARAELLARRAAHGVADDPLSDAP